MLSSAKSWVAFNFLKIIWLYLRGSKATKGLKGLSVDLLHLIFSQPLYKVDLKVG